MSDYTKWKKQIIKAAEAEGWTVFTNTTGHTTLRAPHHVRDNDGRLVALVMTGTPSDYRGRKNAEAQLKKYGVRL